MRISHCHVNAAFAIPELAYFAHNLGMDDLKWIQEGLKRPGKTQRGLAAAMGIDPTGVNRMLQGNREIKANELPKIRAYIEGLSTEPQGDAKPASLSQQAVAAQKGAGLEFLGEDGARRFEGPKDLPILGHVKAGADGRFYDQGDRQGVTMRPDALMHVKSAYAVRVRDMSMYPAYEPNDLVHVNPTLAVVPNNNVVIQLLDGQAFVKLLVRRTERAVICQEWHPEKRKIEYDPKQIQFIHMIVRTK